MYLKLNNGFIEKYPYTIGELRKDNPQVSFPSNIPQETLAEFEVCPVVVTGAPEHNSDTQYQTEGTPVFSLERNRWEQTWVINSYSEEDIQARIDIQWSRIRAERNQKLSACDWTQLPDCPLNNTKQLEWANYRQALRDITEQLDPFNIIYPTEPQ